MEEKNIEKIVIHYDNGEENTIHKGFMCGIKEDTESGEATLDFTMCHISGRDLEMIVMGCLQLGERLARELERKYHISSKQYTEEGIRLRLLGENMPSESGCIACDVTLEDAYIYVTNR